jgi:hypothetical protein
VRKIRQDNNESSIFALTVWVLCVFVFLSSWREPGQISKDLYYFVNRIYFEMVTVLCVKRKYSGKGNQGTKGYRKNISALGKQWHV